MIVSKVTLLSRGEKRADTMTAWPWSAAPTKVARFGTVTASEPTPAGCGIGICGKGRVSAGSIPRVPNEPNGIEAAAALMKGGSGPISFTAKDARSWIAPDDEAVDYDKLRREMRLFPRFLFFASFGGVAGLRLAVREAVERTRHDEYPHSHISI